MFVVLAQQNDTSEYTITAPPTEKLRINDLLVFQTIYNREITLTVMTAYIQSILNF